MQWNRQHAWPTVVFALYLACFQSRAMGQAIPYSSTQFSVLRLGSRSATVEVDAFFDLACINTKEVWPTMKSVVRTYNDKVLFRFHLFPLPYHQYAYTLAKAAHIVAHYGNTSSTLAFFEISFDKQETILNAPTASDTYDDVKSRIAAWATNETGISEVDFAEGWNDDDLEMETRYAWKYSALRGVYGTPTFMINGVMTGDLSSVSQWREALDPLTSAGVEAVSKAHLVVEVNPGLRSSEWSWRRE